MCVLRNKIKGYKKLQSFFGEIMNLKSINDAIIELENSKSTYDNVQELSALYIVREHLKQTPDIVEKELNDILPCYRQYINIKRDYQIGRATDDLLVNSMENVCKEITEFIETLYNNTELLKERLKIEKMIKELSEKYNPG